MFMFYYSKFISFTFYTVHFLNVHHFVYSAFFIMLFKSPKIDVNKLKVQKRGDFISLLNFQ